MRVLILFILVCGCHRTTDPASTAVTDPLRSRGVASPQGEVALPALRVPLPPPAHPATRDSGLFGELDSEVVLQGADWLDTSAALYIANGHGDTFVYVSGRAVGLAATDVVADITLDDFAGADLDGDQIPDELDVLVGAKKAALNAAPYGSPYQEVPFPGGDVPRTEGVCTDTVVRAVRNAGHDLQESLNLDIHKRPRAFPMVKRPNPNIDHRRVKTLLPHFERHWISLGPDPDDVLAPWFPGDIIFMQTMGDSRPDHMGVVSDSPGVAAPLIINNFTDGYSTAAMDIARLAPITHRFRFPSSLSLPAPHGGVAGMLHRQGLTVPEESEQLVVVTVHGWKSPGGRLRRYRRDGSRFVVVGPSIDVTVGAAGLGVGRGLSAPDEGPAKVEGDRRAPAGVFALGTAFGRNKHALRGKWPYRRLTAQDRFVDDPKSEHYNSWQQESSDADWTSAERMDAYELGLVVNHNMPATAEAGSAIFLHTWGEGGARATVGCTAMSTQDLRRVLEWLDPLKKPVFVQVAGHVFEER